MKKETKQGDYNYYTSICNVCYQKGWHEKPTKCVREYHGHCKECGQTIDRINKCKGTNILIDYSNCSKKFAPYYHKDIRIKVDFGGYIKTGTVGMTTGWKPVFILMLRKNSTGSSHILSDKCNIL